MEDREQLICSSRRKRWTQYFALGIRGTRIKATALFFYPWSWDLLSGGCRENDVSWGKLLTRWATLGANAADEQSDALTAAAPEPSGSHQLWGHSQAIMCGRRTKQSTTDHPSAPALVPRSWVVDIDTCICMMGAGTGNKPTIRVGWTRLRICRLCWSEKLL